MLIVALRIQSTISSSRSFWKNPQFSPCIIKLP